MSRTDDERFADIVDCCRRLRDIALVGEHGFLSDELLQDAACYRLAVIGEALNHLSDDFKKQHPDLDIPDARGMRNQLTHEYHKVDLDVVWNTITTDIPNLEQTLSGVSGPFHLMGGVDPIVETLGAGSRRGGICGSTDTIDGKPCRQAAPSPGRRCASGH